MRLLVPLTLCVVGASALAERTPAPTPAPTPVPTVAYAQVNYNFLFKRQDCPAGTYQCSEPGFGNACCSNSQVCARDESNAPACCPVGYVIPSAFVPSPVKLAKASFLTTY